MSTYSKPIQALMQFLWCDQSVVENPLASLVADVFWWERRDNVDQKIKTALQDNDLSKSEKLFCLAYISMSIGDLKSFTNYSKQLNFEGDNELQNWLDVELLGRQKQYLKQAKKIRTFLVSVENFPDWLATACISSLNHNGIDPKPLYKVLLENRKITTALETVLAARLISAMGDVKLALSTLQISLRKWPESAPLNWFTGMLEAQVGNPISAFQYINVAEKQGLIEIQAARYLMGLATSLPLTFESDNVHKVYNRISKYVVTNERQSSEIAGLYCIALWKEGNLQDLHQLLKQFHGFQHFEEKGSDRAAQIFMRYAVFLCIAWQHNRHLYLENKKAGSLYIIGESHALTASNMIIQWQSQIVKVTSLFVMGAKMWHFASKANNQYKELINLNIELIPNNGKILFIIGEIDCRPDEGIWKQHKKTERSLKVIITETVSGYLDYIFKLTLNRPNNNITIAGIPAPGYSLTGNRDPGNQIKFLDLIFQVNALLKKISLSHGWNFLDIYSATSDEIGKGNNVWHLDNWHLQPTFYSQVNNWIVTPEINAALDKTP